MKSPPSTEGLSIQEIFLSDKAKVSEWLSHAEKFLKLYMNGNRELIKAEDIVGDILIKMVDGKRNWNPAKVDINAFMYNAIRSHVDGIAKKEKRNISIDKYNEETESFENELDKEHFISLQSIVDKQDLKERLELARERIKDDADCEIIFNCMYEGMRLPEMAADLGMTIQEVRIIIRRMRYKIRKGLN